MRGATDGALDGAAEVEEGATAAGLPPPRCPLIIPAATRQGDIAVAIVTPKANMSTGIVGDLVGYLIEVEICAERLANASCK